ncbi:MAG: LamG domain-containing protein, partial [Candidatus Aenigmarchaeota archaeon]|nr:LamG domain-containing protein [Candidatus Aenigmarchaeota archaeon]
SISSGWHHVALVYDKDGGTNNLNLYVDGVLATTSTLTGAITANTNEIEIGKNFTNGIVDEVKLWRRALTAAEIDFEYDASIKKITTSREIPTISPSTTGTVNTTIVLASPGSNFFDDVIVKSGPKKLRFVVPYQNIDIVNQSRFGPGGP